MTKKSFLMGAAVLGIAGLMVQILGAVFRIPLANIIGDEGMGYYQTAYPLYIFLLVFSTNGAPAAISKMISERTALGRHKEAHRVFRLSFVVMVALGIICWAIIHFGANLIIDLTHAHADSYYAIIAIAPALFFVPIMAVFRGYFQGMQQMGPTAVSQMAEQVVRVATGLTLALILMRTGVKYAAAGATFGATIGPVVGVIVLIIIYKRKKKALLADIEADTHGEREPAGSILKTLALIAIPVTIGVSIQPIMNLGDVALVMNRLQAAGFSGAEANALYGQLSGYAGPIINIPMALALSMALSMVPAIAGAKSAGDSDFLNQNISLGMRTSMMIGVPCSFGLMALAEPIMKLLYPLQEESAVSAARCLFILAVGIIFLCIAQTMAGVLQGLDRISMSVVGLACGFAVKCVLTFILTAVPSLGVNGAAAATVAGYIVIAAVNLWAVKKAAGTRFDLMKCVVKPVLSGAVMTVAAILVYRVCAGIVGNSLAVCAAILVAAVVYAFMLLKTRAIAPEEIEKLPKGTKIVSLMRKLRLC